MKTIAWIGLIAVVLIGILLILGGYVFVGSQSCEQDSDCVGVSGVGGCWNKNNQPHSFYRYTVTFAGPGSCLCEENQCVEGGLYKALGTSDKKRAEEICSLIIDSDTQEECYRKVCLNFSEGTGIVKC